MAIPPVLKTGVRKDLWVRIPPPPPSLRRSSKSVGELRKATARRSPPLMFYYVYILKCGNNRLYIGCTRNLKERINRHNKGHIPATKELRPLKLITYFAFSNKYIAFNFEKYLKTASGRAFLKKRLI